jgi:pullulanase
MPSASAGLTHIHLLPAFDCATINENKVQRVEPDAALLATYPPDSDQQAEAVRATADQDGFNWCYDPFHYNVPERSYSTDPNGSRRIYEFRSMVQSLHQNHLRVVMDVVYNHTTAAGQAEKSVLDKVVPGYYQRRNLDGDIETSTCCQNTASEHAMMEKLLIDSVLMWARQYKVDASAPATKRSNTATRRSRGGSWSCTRFRPNRRTPWCAWRRSIARPGRSACRRARRRCS